MKDEINPNVLVYEPSPGKMTELFQTGQANIAVWGTGRVKAFANTGFPVDFIYPKEGAPILLASRLSGRRGSKQAAEAQRVHQVHADAGPVADGAGQGDAGYGPVNTKVELKCRAADRPAHRPEQMSKLVIVPTGTRSTPTARTGPSAGPAKSSADP